MKTISIALLLLTALTLLSSVAIADESTPALLFSKERGFYTNPFTLTIATENHGGTIQWTTDGSDPRFSSRAYSSASPVVLTVDPADTTGRGAAPGFVVRAVVCQSDTAADPVVTHTYLFVDKAGELSPDGQKPGPGWPEPAYNRQEMNYGLDPDVLNDPRYRDQMSEALLSIPTVSLVTDLGNLFSPDSGIYVNAMQQGSEWERSASVELINPDGSEGFQINAGLRIRGGYSRHANYPKHAFRLFFREEYGAAKLEFPLFENEGVDEFDKVDLRCPQNYAWSNFDYQGVFNIMIRDVFSRDLQRDMGRPYTRSRFYHLYLDGTYWGIFQTQERPEARYAASYFGGSSEDYDVVKVAVDLGYGIEATDGNLDTWRSVWDLCQAGFFSQANYNRLIGLDAAGNRDPSLPVLVDLDNLIDYMIIILQTGNFDSPVTKFGQNKGANNFYAIYDRNKKDGFKFFVHDAEHTLFISPAADPGIGLYENRVNIGDLTDYYKMTVASFNQFHPQWLHYKLSQNPEYRIRFADRVYRHFFNGGALTPQANIDRFMKRAMEIDEAIIAESARWGDCRWSPPRTKHDDWLPQIDNVVDNFFPYRNPIVIDQLKQVALYPAVEPPTFDRKGRKIETPAETVEPGEIVIARNPSASGIVHLTLDGTDPRLFGGFVSPNAFARPDTMPLSIITTTVIKARVLDGADWSPLHEITLSVRNGLPGLKLTEIHYRPLDMDTVDGREFEFVELKNTGAVPLNLTAAAFVNGIDYAFPTSAALDAGKFIVLASNRENFERRYGFAPFGEYAGQLDNNGERIALCDAAGDTVINVRYNDKAPWPTDPDTLGYSLVSKDSDPTGDPNDPAAWRASRNVNGSPGMDDDASAVETAGSRPDRFELAQNYPNPFNPETVISYSLPEQKAVTVKIYNASGQAIRTLFEGNSPAGQHGIIWDSRDDSGRKASSGLYICRVKAGTDVRSMKMILMK